MNSALVQAMIVIRLVFPLACMMLGITTGFRWGSQFGPVGMVTGLLMGLFGGSAVAHIWFTGFCRFLERVASFPAIPEGLRSLSRQPKSPKQNTAQTHRRFLRDFAVVLGIVTLLGVVSSIIFRDYWMLLLFPASLLTLVVLASIIAGLLILDNRMSSIWSRFLEQATGRSKR